MTDHTTRISEALERFALSNRQPAIDEPENDFERAVNAWYELQLLQNEIKDLLKPLNADEREMRDGISDSLRKFFGDGLKEGMNTYTLSNKRKLKFEHKVDRKVDAAMVPVARAAYEKAAPEGGAFDDLLRVKYELAVAPFRKLDGDALTAVSRMLDSKHAAPTLKVD